MTNMTKKTLQTLFLVSYSSSSTLSVRRIFKTSLLACLDGFLSLSRLGLSIIFRRGESIYSKVYVGSLRFGILIVRGEFDFSDSYFSLNTLLTILLMLAHSVCLSCLVLPMSRAGSVVTLKSISSLLSCRYFLTSSSKLTRDWWIKRVACREAICLSASRMTSKAYLFLNINSVMCCLS